PEAFGKDQKHMRLRVVGAGNAKRSSTPSYPQAVAFGLYDTLAPHLFNAPLVDLAVTPEVNEWNGTRRVQLIVKDIRPASAETPMAARRRRVAQEIAATKDQLDEIVVRDGRGQ